MQITVDPSERWVILGKTGSGKTEFAKHMLRIVSQKMPIVVIDPKELWLGPYPQWETNKRKPGTIDKPHLVQKFNPKFHVQCLQVDEEEEEPLARMCYDVLKKGRWFMYFDETDGIATAHHVPTHIRKIWKTGRAKGIGAWVSTQVPTGIPRIFKSQAEKFFVFKVGDEDVESSAALVHATKEEVANLAKYEYLYYDAGTMDAAAWMPPVPFKQRKAV